VLGGASQGVWAVWGAKAFGKNGFLHSRFSFHKMCRAFKKRHFVVVAQIGGHSLVQGSLAVSQAGIQLWASQLWGEKSLPKKTQLHHLLRD